jgi:DNA-binding transcriptional regulator GbsR (MarR family)
MMGSSLKAYSRLVRYFEKQVEWLGLARNAGPVLAVLYLAKYKTGSKMSAEEISESTSYSRSSVGLILSQLEALSLAFGEADYTQTGRGRRRTLYTIEESGSSLASLIVKKTVGRLQESIHEIESLEKLYGSDAPFVTQMLDDFRKEALENLAVCNRSVIESK